MADTKNIGLVILGIVAIIAVIGLVLMFTQAGTPVGRQVGWYGQGRFYTGSEVCTKKYIDTLPGGTYKDGLINWCINYRHSTQITGIPDEYRGGYSS